MITTPNPAPEYAVMFSGAFERTTSGIVPVPGRLLDATAYGALVQRANGMEHEVLRRTNGGPWLSLRGQTPAEVVASRWTD
jgi:hypothetical protein